MKKKMIWIGLPLVLVGMGYGWHRHKAKNVEQAKPTYTLAFAEIRDLRTTVESTGVVNPRNRLDVKPPIGGRLEELLVDEGDEVDKGQIIGWISSTERATLLDAALATSQEELDYWQQLYKPTPLIAPLAGTIIARNFEPGQSISPSDAVVAIADDLIVVANVDETDIGLIKGGQKVQVRMDAYPDQEFHGAVETVAYDATISSGITMYQVDVRPDHIPEYARSGMNAELEFVVDERFGVVAIPAAALKNAPDGAPNSAVVLVGPPENPRELLVETGYNDDSYTQIVKGLQVGDEVLVPELIEFSDDKGGWGNRRERE
jgi:macrolide-specific efflux system membrane fusion protein